LCDFVVIAAGGPGKLYRDGVYPRSRFGALGLALPRGGIPAGYDIAVVRMFVVVMPRPSDRRSG
jgi:hypothetical protein